MRVCAWCRIGENPAVNIRHCTFLELPRNQTLYYRQIAGYQRGIGDHSNVKLMYNVHNSIINPPKQLFELTNLIHTLPYPRHSMDPLLLPLPMACNFRTYNIHVLIITNS